MKRALAAIAALGLAGTAPAAIVSLESVSSSGSNFTFNYQATLNPDEGLRTGDRIVVFDFAGYVAGSIFSNSSNLVASIENVSSSALVTPGFNDDASLANLVFTYTGPNFRSSGPLAPFSFAVGADSIYGQTIVDAFFSLTTKNNPSRERGTKIYTLGQTTVPTFNQVPEPASWALMIGGFGLVGAAMRRRTATPKVLA